MAGGHRHRDREPLFERVCAETAVALKNFRSMWQGQTEGNLERVLSLLRAMSPIAVDLLTGALPRALTARSWGTLLRAPALTCSRSARL